jgi:alpha-galactosidase
MLRNQPLLLYRMCLRHVGGEKLRLGRLGFLSAGRAHPKGMLHAWEPASSQGAPGGLTLPGDRSQVRFYTQGWQSWSYAGSLGVNERQPWTRLGPLNHSVLFNPDTGHPSGNGHFVSDMFGAILQPAEHSGMLAGFVSQRQTFGSLEVNLSASEPGLRMWASADGLLLNPGDTFETDWSCLAWLSLEDPDPLADYLELAAEAGEARRGRSAPTGWSSWYYFFDSVTREAVDRNIAWLEQRKAVLPLQVAQIDDGFEADVGDWLRFDEGFEGGLKPVSERMAGAGLVPGLWLAPFIAKPRSAWVRAHPEWVVRQAGGRPASAGYNWSTFTVGLDPTHPGVQDAVTELIETAVGAWGFKFLKLDFLYAAALAGRRFDPATTRAQAMHRALTTVRSAAGEDVWLLGCGCPLGSGIGIFDSMRIGPDTAPRWKPAYQGIEFFFGKEPNLPSVRNSLRATVNRSMLNRIWWINDPDCLIVRGTDTHLSTDEVQLMASVVALSGGSLVDSDDLTKLSADRLTWLSRLIPPLPAPAKIHGQFDHSSPDMLSLDLGGAVGKWTLVCLVNWEATPQRRTLRPESLGLDPSQGYWGADFWAEALVDPGPPPWSFDVPPHGVRLFSLRRRDDSTPSWLGDTLHISQGLVVGEWQTSGGRLRAKLMPGHQTSGRIWLAIREKPVEAHLGHQSLAFQACGSGVLTAQVAVDQESELNLRWEA